MFRLLLLLGVAGVFSNPATGSERMTCMVFRDLHEPGIAPAEEAKQYAYVIEKTLTNNQGALGNKQKSIYTIYLSTYFSPKDQATPAFKQAINSQINAHLTKEEKTNRKNGTHNLIRVFANTHPFKVLISPSSRNEHSADLKQKNGAKLTGYSRECNGRQRADAESSATAT